MALGSNRVGSRTPAEAALAISRDEETNGFARRVTRAAPFRNNAWTNSVTVMSAADLAMTTQRLRQTTLSMIFSPSIFCPKKNTTMYAEYSASNYLENERIHVPMGARFIKLSWYRNTV